MIQRIWRRLGAVAPYTLAILSLGCIVVGGFCVFGEIGWFVAGGCAAALEWRVNLERAERGLRHRQT